MSRRGPSLEPQFGHGSDGAVAAATDVDSEQLARIAEALSQSWSRDTSAQPEIWSEETPAQGQCAVTALVVQELLGGDLLRGDVRRTSHYWNLLPSGSELDLTRYQFGSHVQPESVGKRSRDYVLAFPDTRARYRRLRGKVMARLCAAGERSSEAEAEAEVEVEVEVERASRVQAILATRD